MPIESISEQKMHQTLQQVFHLVVSSGRGAVAQFEDVSDFGNEIKSFSTSLRLALRPAAFSHVGESEATVFLDERWSEV